MQLSADPALAQMLGGKRGGLTFALPNSANYRLVIATSGNVPNTPTQLESLFAKRAAGAISPKG